MYSVKETDWLLSKPLAFFKDIFTYGYRDAGNVFSGTNSYWNDLKSNLVIKLLALCNVLTFKSYYTNIILFNFLFLFGLVGLARVADTHLHAKKWMIALAIFLMPSTLFWCSGIHKDGLILSLTGMVIFLFHKILENKNDAFKRITGCLVCLFFIFLLRSYVALALIPALLSWWFCKRLKTHYLVIFSVVYSVGIALFFLLPFLVPGLNFPAFLSNKQHEFLLLKGGSGLRVLPLEPTIGSFINYLPSALDIAFLRPHLSEAKNPASMLALNELLMIAVLLILAFVFPLKNQDNIRRGQPPLTFFLLFFGISLLLIAGYTVTFTGALVRYRSFALPFIVLPLLTFINFQAIKLPLRLYRRNS
ncbi:MAG: hypothetical protein LH478_06160 [Chitinophagaceae bacterium]|nr:hypothetical protein [Chitinophagaceae bacterium]